MVKTRGPYPSEVVTIPEGQVWVEGDEGFHSIDSNSYGPVITRPFRPCCGIVLTPNQISKGLVTARVTHVLLPFKRAGRIVEEFKGRRGALVHKAS